MMKHGFHILMLLFTCVATLYIGNVACDEQPRILTPTTAEMIEFNELYESQKEYWERSAATNTALIMIVRSIDRLTDAVKEHECLSN